MLEDGVARATGDFNNDGMADMALWQEPDFGPYGGPVFLYLGRRDGRFAAAGTIVVSAASLFKPVPAARGSAKLIVCEPRGDGEAVAGGYALDGFTVSDLPPAELPRKCPGVETFAVEHLDVERYRANGLQAWIRR